MNNDIFLASEADRCLLCHNAPCNKFCKSADVARAIRSVRFDNPYNAYQFLKNITPEETELAEKNCLHYDFPIRIGKIVNILRNNYNKYNKEQYQDISLRIKFCGIECENPFFLASSSVCTSYDMTARAFDMGWAGVFYKTICLQDINEVSPRFDATYDQSNAGKFYGLRNMEQLSENTAKQDFAILKQLKEKYPSKVVIASIMGQNEEEWALLAKMAQDAKADAVELNFSCPQMTYSNMGSDVGQSEELVRKYTLFVKNAVNIPVIAKMTPNITDITIPARACTEAKADGISAINTIKSLTLNNRVAVSDNFAVSGYSGKAIKPIAQRFVAELCKDKQLQGVQISGVGGIETWRDALEYIQLGCSNVQICTSVMQYGYRIIEDLISGLKLYMSANNCNDLQELVGQKLKSIVKAEDLDRQTFVLPKVNKEKCVGCYRCFVSCSDAGHQAIDITKSIPHINARKCVGCHLCLLICPTNAIEKTKRIRKTAVKK
ncbi:MAG: NAD-dependent dihydropyrimidine dehydrogenase subunit PreA [Bacteroidales bacterium]|nr:NAD-dependent dihydropyrimidine dehydrogenase subunit PreA [Bacteroidales bacterium]